jgi:hypothetical protein
MIIKYKMHFKIILPFIPTSSTWSPSVQIFQLKYRVHFSMNVIRPYHLVLLIFINQITSKKSTNYAVPHVVFSNLLLLPLS